MKRFFLSWFYIISSVIACQAQISCDSLYAREDRTWKACNDKGHVGLMVFDIPPHVVLGKEKLTNYTNNQGKVGVVTYRVRIDSLGNPSCLQFSYTTNRLLVAVQQHCGNLKV